MDQPEQFEPGRFRSVFQILFDGSNLVWHLDGRTSTASGGASSGLCEAAPNVSPDFSSTPPTTTNEDEAFLYQATATDPDGDALTFFLVQGPLGMSLDGVSGALEWLPVQKDIGEHSVLLRVEDGQGGSDEQSFTLTVLNVNDAPVITSQPSLQALPDSFASPGCYLLRFDP